jgi:CRP-like cAMP-binding protein
MTAHYEDPLVYLQRKPLQEFAKSTTIYAPPRTSDHLYLVSMGRVKITTAVSEGTLTTARIVPPEGFFGESCILGSPSPSESAVTLDKVVLMSWSRREIEQQIEREPRLGLALAQFLVRRCRQLEERIESMALYKTPERVMLAFLQLAAEQGSQRDGSIRIAPLTHLSIGEYVGTSREIITFQMNRLRRSGMIRYSRQFIDIDTRAIEDALCHRGVRARLAPPPAARRARV